MLEFYDEENKKKLRQANQPMELRNKKGFGKLMQKQARAAIEDKEREGEGLPAREFKKAEVKNLTADSVLAEEMEKEEKERLEKEKLEEKEKIEQDKMDKKDEVSSDD